MRGRRQSWATAAVGLTWSVFVLLTGTASLEADHNRLLQREFRRAISRHVACDSQGYCYLLIPSPTSVGGPGFTLKISQKPHPESISDFPVTVSLPTLQDRSPGPAAHHLHDRARSDRLQRRGDTTIANRQGLATVVGSRQRASGRTRAHTNPIMGGRHLPITQRADLADLDNR